jgi:hypothetical protein
MPQTAEKCGKFGIFVANSTLYGLIEAVMGKCGFCIDYFFTTFVLSCYDFNYKRFK